ncbi:MAG: DegT/DnrJ/EryC1/StrS family aminotransferase [Elusimicrobiota bacterium]
MKIQMVDMLRGYRPIQKETEEAVKRVLEKAHFILGEDVAEFEKEFASFTGAKYAVSVASGTDALRLAILACGIKEGDEVITTPFTFIATSETISQAGAKPVFADILDDGTYNIDPKSIEKKITSKTKAIIPVHLYGHPADMDSIMEIAKKHNLKVIEDCAQSFTGKYKYKGEWKQLGTIGDCGTFSFFPAKNLGAFGDGGLITANDEKTAQTIKTLRNHGSSQRYLYEMEGFNSRLDTIQAAILRIRLKHVAKWTEMRNEVMKKYNEALKDVCAVPIVKDNCYHSCNYYTLRFSSKEERDFVQQHLNKKEIANQIYYPICLHLQKAYERLKYKKGDLPVCEKIQDEVLSLPMYPELSDQEIKEITQEVREAVNSFRKAKV